MRVVRHRSLLLIAVLLTLIPATIASGESAHADSATSAPGLMPDGSLDPATFEGPLLVALPSGSEVMAVVAAGEAASVAAEIRAADAAGDLSRHVVQTRAAGCGVKVR